MRAGTLRHQADFEVLEGTGLTARGETQKEYVKRLRGMQVAIRQLSARETELARQLYPTATHELRTRYFNLGRDVTARFVFGERAFNIHTFNNVGERNIELTFTCTEALKSDA